MFLQNYYCFFFRSKTFILTPHEHTSFTLINHWPFEIVMTQRCCFSFCRRYGFFLSCRGENLARWKCSFFLFCGLVIILKQRIYTYWSGNLAFCFGNCISVLLHMRLLAIVLCNFGYSARLLCYTCSSDCFSSFFCCSKMKIKLFLWFHLENIAYFRANLWAKTQELLWPNSNNIETITCTHIDNFMSAQCDLVWTKRRGKRWNNKRKYNKSQQLRIHYTMRIAFH